MEIRNVVFGTGRPKLCVPLVSADTESLGKECGRLRGAPLDLLEWRVDYGLSRDNHDFSHAMQVVRTYFSCPVLVTLRTKQQGGAWIGSDEDYFSFLSQLAELEEADIIDVEMGHQDGNAKAAIEHIHASGKKALASFHRFDGMMSERDMVGELERMDESGADMLKIAVMPQTEEDVLSVFSAARRMKKRTDKPLVLIGMGRAGILTRVAGGGFGGDMTFAAGEKASAPGQIGVADMRRILEALYGE